MAQSALPARPALELGATTVLSKPVELSGKGSDVYRAPVDYQSPDLGATNGQPPAALGQFWTQPQPK